MDILYLTLSDPQLNSDGIYADLLNGLHEKGHHVTIAFADSPRNTKETTLVNENGIALLKVRVGELFGVNFIKKGLSTLKIEPCLKAAIKKYFGKAHFDLVLYATPPVTFAGVVSYCRKTYGCRSFLMLKDIFPQNAVDIGLFSDGGLLHRIFRNKEKILYEVSDIIGCMSAKNKEYILQHNPGLDKEKLIIFPNTIKVQPIPAKDVSPKTEDKVRFVFGGNLGKPQAVDFLIRAINSDRVRACKQAEFLFVGNGSEQEKVREAFSNSPNAQFMEFMPVEEYNRLMQSCDIGLISLDARFTIPNYPSRTLGYMANAKPMLACTDRNTDIKELLTEEAKCGLWCASDDLEAFCSCVERLCESMELRNQLGHNGRVYLEQHFNVDVSIGLIEKYGLKGE